MKYRVLLAPEPPQYTAELDVEQFALLDSRFGHLAELERRRIVQAVVQDSADLQVSHIVLKTPAGDICGDPGSLDERQGDQINLLACPALSEEALVRCLALDLVSCVQQTVSRPEFGMEVSCWSRGVLYAFRLGRNGQEDVVCRRLDLARFIDCLELECLMTSSLNGVLALRAHRLRQNGAFQVLRTVL